jgi:peptidoglycan/xylan/chitin deacetylase (PgdA/CDA1 family)
MGRRVAATVLLLALAGGTVLAITLRSRTSPKPARPAIESRPRPLTDEQLLHALIASRLRHPHGAPVPILMYHVLGVPGPTAPHPQLFVKPSDFAAQMRWLGRHGYHGVTLDHVYRNWHYGIALPARPVVVSFDDGYERDYAVAMPALQRSGWPGVLDLVVRNVVPGDLPAPQVRALIAAGWEIDAHSITHPDLTTPGPAQLQWEVAGSRAILQRRFGQPVDFFCYPLGRYDRAVVPAVRKAGYFGATTVEAGLAVRSEPFTLKRIRVDYRDGLSGFAAKLERYAS